MLGFATLLAMTWACAGREAERVVLLRRMHDIVLQTLEAMAPQPLPTRRPATGCAFKWHWDGCTAQR